MKSDIEHTGPVYNAMDFTLPMPRILTHYSVSTSELIETSIKYDELIIKNGVLMTTVYIFITFYVV